MSKHIISKPYLINKTKKKKNNNKTNIQKELKQ